MYSQGNEIMYTGKKAIKTIPPNKCNVHAQSLNNRFTYSDGATPCRQKQSKEMATPIDKGGRQGPWTVCGVEPG